MGYLTALFKLQTRVIIKHKFEILSNVSVVTILNLS